MSDLSEFLLARIAEDEVEARAATPGPWRYNPEKEWHTNPDMLARATQGRLTFGGEEFVGAGPRYATVCVAATGYSDGPQSVRDARFIARHDPSRVLAECEAKRRIVEWASDGEGEWHWSTVLGPLASVYSDHPDYDEAWRD